MTPRSSIITHVRLRLNPRGARRWMFLLAIAGSMIAPVGQAQDVANTSFPSLRFSAESIEFGENRVSGLDLLIEPDGTFSLETEGLTDGLEDGLNLPGLAFDGVLGTFEVGDSGLKANGLLRYQGLETDWYLTTGENRFSACLVTVAQPLALLAGQFGLPAQAAWLKSGEVDTCIRYGADSAGDAGLSVDVALSGVSFDSPDGLYAAEGLAMDLFFETTLPGLGGARLTGTLSAGAILLDHFYADFATAPLNLEVTPVTKDDALLGAVLAVTDDGAIDLETRLVVDEESAWRLDIEKLNLLFPAAYERYLEPIAAAWTLDGLEVTGGVSWNGAWSPGRLRSGNLDIQDLTVVDTRRGRFALTGLETRLRPGDYAFDSTFAWRGLLLGRVNLGAGVAHLDAQPGAFALLSPLELGVLGGQLRLDRFAYVLPGSPVAESGQPRMELKAGLSGIDMAQLTAAFDWPSFSGTLDGEIPRVSLTGGVLSVDGEIRVDVFGGTITVRDLETERPFGVLPSLAANVDMHDLDLEQLTETFEFGRIGGRVDGHLKDLRLLDWRPVAFDGWLGTPERRSGTSAISRQAVNHLASIGGGGSVSALTGPLLRMFNNFSYRRLGLGCRLENNLCSITGLSEDGESVLLLEGAGIPKITVRAFNRRVDWPQMVANLVAISEGEGIRIGDEP
ncbi:MAG: hypothetical protein HKO85_07555 [Xanthomonadales bacterium]|nr:YdbH domain-containing protein [Gammaproteobacteria bacterium]NNL05130.1 hypothetical protein [Xanthomonadales bacterium]